MSAGAPTVGGMQYLDAYPVVFVRDLPATVLFYTGTLGLEALFESDFFVLLALPGDERGAAAFVSEAHPTAPPERPGDRAGIERVPDPAGRRCRRGTRPSSSARESPSSTPLRDEPWGQRRFGLLDPNGLYVDVVEQTEPDPDFWPRYGVGR